MINKHENVFIELFVRIIKLRPCNAICEQGFTFHSNLPVGFLLTGLKIRRWLQVVDADDSRGRFVMYHPWPILLGADLRALPINVEYRRAATYFQFAAHEVLGRNQELEPDLRDMPLRFVRVEGTVRTNVRLERLRRKKYKKTEINQLKLRSSKIFLSVLAQRVYCYRDMYKNMCKKKKK